MALTFETFVLPAYWASALINGDESGLRDDEAKALESFTDELVREYGKSWAVDVSEESWFGKHHDAWHHWPYAGDVATFTFDVTP